MTSTFYPSRLCIADKSRRERLIKLLKFGDHFKWNTSSLPSVSKQDKIFTTTKGTY